MPLSGEIGELLTDAVNRKAYALDAIFDETYRSIPATNPVQYDTFTVSFIEQFGCPMMDQIVGLDTRIVSPGIFDRNGYMAATTSPMSQPQRRNDVHWNDGNAQNKRRYTHRHRFGSMGVSGERYASSIVPKRYSTEQRMR